MGSYRSHTHTQFHNSVSDSTRPFPGRKRFDQALLGRGQNTLESDDNQIVGQMCASVFRSAAHVFLLEAAPALRSDAIGFALSIHQNRYNTEYSDILLAFAGRKVYHASVAELSVC